MKVKNFAQVIQKKISKIDVAIVFLAVMVIAVGMSPQL
jgi:hypothetical protein